VKEKFTDYCDEARNNRQGWLLSHTVHRNSAKNREIDSKMRLNEPWRVFFAG